MVMPENPGILFTEATDSQSSIMWVKREDGGFYAETRSIYGGATVLVIDRQEAERLAHFLTH